MTDQSNPQGASFKVDRALLALAVIALCIALYDMNEFLYTIDFTIKAISGTAPFIAFAVLAVAYLKATGAETLLAKAFEGAPQKMIILAALLGGLSPFCSCEVIPFIAALLALGAPLSAVMAFWLASPLMDPAMFLITSGTLGWSFAMAKTLSAIGIGLMGGFVTLAFAQTPLFADPLREKPQIGGCCGVKAPFQGQPVWRFWNERERREVFTSTGLDNVVFRSGMAPTIPAARQLVNHGHIRVNGNKVDRASFRVKIGDMIEPKPKSKNIGGVAECWKHPAHERPNWLSNEAGKMSVRVESLPTPETLLFPLDVNLVLEYYAKRM